MGLLYAAEIEVFMLKQSLLVAALLAASHSAYAQAPPNAGEQLRQIPPALTPEDIEPELRFEPPSPPAAPLPDSARIEVRSVRVTGQTVFTESELIAASAFGGAASLSLADLRDMAARISAFYNQRGYFLAQAYLPAQDIENGLVTIAVIEGRYGEVRLQNRSRLNDGDALGVLDGLGSGDLIANAPLERRLLLLSDIPGVVVRSTLSPGQAVGTSNLSVDLEPAPRVSGSIEADNAGGRYTGEYRAGGTVNFNNPTGRGDIASLRVLGSDGGLAYGRASYHTPAGLGTVGASYAYLRYELGREFEALDAEGRAQVFSLHASYPVVRSRARNLYAFADVDLKTFHDEVGSVSTTSRRRAQVLTIGLSGDSRDSFGGGGWTAYSLSGSLGSLDIRSPLDLAADNLTARANGDYGKLQFSAARLQSVSGPLSLYAAVRGQVASTNLDSSEKMELGGAYGVRAYPEGEAYGDEGYIATLEARLRLSNLPVQAQLIGFVDAGAVRNSHTPWSVGSNDEHRSAIGAGVNLELPANWLLKVSYAVRLGDQEPTSTPGHARRAWVQLARTF